MIQLTDILIWSLITRIYVVLACICSNRFAFPFYAMLSLFLYLIKLQYYKCLQGRSQMLLVKEQFANKIFC